MKEKEDIEEQKERQIVSSYLVPAQLLPARRLPASAACAWNCVVVYRRNSDQSQCTESTRTMNGDKYSHSFFRLHRGGLAICSQSDAKSWSTNSACTADFNKMREKSMRGAPTKRKENMS
jgi:hypothetical protein